MQQCFQYNTIASIARICGSRIKTMHGKKTAIPLWIGPELFCIDSPSIAQWYCLVGTLSYQKIAQIIATFLSKLMEFG